MKQLMLLLFIGLLLAVAGSSCKKGCTNPKAINYSPSAKTEDASCLFCDSMVMDVYRDSFNLADNNFGTSHYGFVVLGVTATGNLLNYQGNNCARIADNNTCISSIKNNALVGFTFTNFTSDTLVVNGNFLVFPNLATNFPAFTRITDLAIAPFGTYHVPDTAFFTCIGSNNASASINYNSVSFQYR